jgi:hypothetical protein
MSHTYNTKATATRSNANPLTYTHNCGSGTTLLVLGLVIGGGTDRTGGAPTYNGTAFTQAGTNQKAASSPETVVELWYLLNPTTGSALTISIPNTNTVYISAVSASFIAGAGSLSKFKEALGATGTSTDPTGATHTGVHPEDLIIGILGTGRDNITGLTESDTLLYEVDDGSYGRSAQYALNSPSSSKIMSWASSTSDDWAIISAVFQKVGDSATCEISKAVSYAVIQPPDGANISKAVAYAVLSVETTVAISKAVAYAVLEPAPPASSSIRPMCMCVC